MLNKDPFINNLWMKYLQTNVVDPYTTYQEDWSWLENSPHPKISGRNLISEFKSLTESEWDDDFFNSVVNTYLETGGRPALEEETIELIRNLGRNRMIMGSFRYGKLCDQNFQDYELVGSAWLRVNLAEMTETYEPLIDAYNMAFLQSKIDQGEGFSLAVIMFAKIIIALDLDWELGAVDDGAHSEKKVS